MEDGRRNEKRGIKQAGQKRRKFANFKFDEDVYINRDDLREGRFVEEAI